MGETTTHTQWQIAAPPGFRFHNEIGGGVSVQIPRGHEGTFLDFMRNEINRLEHNYRHSASMNGETAPTEPAPSADDTGQSVAQ